MIICTTGLLMLVQSRKLSGIKRFFYFSTNNNVNILFIVCKTIKLGVIYHTIDILKMI